MTQAIRFREQPAGFWRAGEEPYQWLSLNAWKHLKGSLTDPDIVTPVLLVQLLRKGLMAALATVVGVLIEVPVMVLVIRVVNQSRGWYLARH